MDDIGSLHGFELFGETAGAFPFPVQVNCEQGDRDPGQGVGRDIRRLLIIGAMSRLNWLGRKSIAEDSWLARLLARKPKMLVAIALANKMTRAIWAMLTKNEDYRDPAQAAVA